MIDTKVVREVLETISHEPVHGIRMGEDGGPDWGTERVLSWLREALNQQEGNPCYVLQTDDGEYTIAFFGNGPKSGCNMMMWKMAQELLPGLCDDNDALREALMALVISLRDDVFVGAADASSKRQWKHYWETLGAARALLGLEVTDGNAR